MKTKYSKVTYCEIPETGSPERRAWQQKNCRKLVGVLERLKPEQHQQHNFTNHCGTAGCALGWAALSNVIPGLQYQKNHYGGCDPVVNGRWIDWNSAGSLFFGDNVMNIVFWDTEASLQFIINQLKIVAEGGTPRYRGFTRYRGFR